MNTRKKSRTIKLKVGSGRGSRTKEHKESKSLREARKQHATAKRGFNIYQMNKRQQKIDEIIREENEEILEEYNQILAERGKEAANNFLNTTKREQEYFKEQQLLEALSERNKRFSNIVRRKDRRYAKARERNETGTMKEHFHKEEELVKNKALRNAQEKQRKKNRWLDIYEEFYVNGVPPEYNTEETEAHQATMNEYKHLRLNEGNLEKESGLLNQINDHSKKNSP
jgi:hypothetical protein